MKKFDIGRWVRRSRGSPRLSLAGAGVATLLLAACGGAGTTASVPRNSGPATLTIWLMTGEISPKTYDAVNAAFAREHPNVKVNIEIQQWSGIATKITTALASGNPPDALEIGNTDVPEFAASGGLMDLSGQRQSLGQGLTWLQGLVGPAEVNGKLFGVPLLAGDRVVIYNRDMFQQAGIASPPTTEAQLLQDGQQLMAAFKGTPDFSALYFPGQYWYAALPLVWDRGGNVAVEQHGKWKGELASPQSLAGLEDFKTIQNTLSNAASRSVNTTNPDQDSVFAQKQAAMIIGGGWEIGVIKQDNPALASSIGVFPFPGVDGRPAPVFLGGSDIAVAANSPHRQLALDWIKLMTGARFQKLMYQNDGLLPNAKQLLGIAASDPVQSVFLEAARNSRPTPASPGWATIEADLTMENTFSAIATGSETVQAAAQAADTHLDTVLNQGS